MKSRNLTIVQRKRHGGRLSIWPETGVLILLLFLAVDVWAAERDRSTKNTITDHAIALAVESEIRADGVVPLDPINITVHDEIVTYEGSVNNLLAKERATKLAETVRGVRTVVNQLQVIPSQSDTDLAVEQRVIEELKSDSLVEPARFQVSVEDGIVTLNGPVDSWHEKFIAGNIVKLVQGVKGLNNKLVRKDQESRSDSEIKEEILKRLKLDVWVPEDSIEVSVDQGHVTLTGTVGSAFAKRQASQYAWSRSL